MPLNTPDDYQQLGEHLQAIDAPLASFAAAHGYEVIPAYFGGRYPNRRITQQGEICRTIHIAMSKQPSGDRFDHFFPDIPYTLFGGAWIDDQQQHKRLNSPFLSTRAIPFSLLVATLPVYLDTFHDYLARITAENIYAYASFSPLGSQPERP